MIIPVLQIMTIGGLVAIKKIEDVFNKRDKEKINNFDEAIKQTEEYIKMTDQQIDELRGTKSDSINIEQEIEQLEAIKKFYEECKKRDEISKKYYERKDK